MATDTVYQGTVAPEAYELDVTPGPAGLDLSTVTAISYKVAKPSGATQTWSGTILTQSSTLLTTKHPFVNGDLNELGDYSIYGILTTGGLPVRCTTRQFRVVDEFTVL